MAYRKVTFHIFEEDFVPGLTVKFLKSGDELIAYTWRDEWDGKVEDYRPSTFSNREDDNVVDTEVFGGTLEQFTRAREISRQYQEVHGREQGVYVHFPRSKKV